MAAIAAMLVCPHQWSEAKKVRVIDGNAPRDGDLVTCAACGTHRVVWPDGTATLFSPEKLSDTPP